MKKQLCNEKTGSFVAIRIGMKSNESEEKGKRPVERYFGIS